MKTASKLMFAAALLTLAGCRHSQGGLAACTAATTTREAIDACTQVIDTRDAPAQERAIAYNTRAGARQGAGDPGGAISDSDAAIALAPRDANFIANRGAIYGMQRQPSRAIPDLLAALRIDPNNTLALGNLAIIYDQRGEWQQGLALVDRIIQVEPKHPQAWEERCWIGAASGGDANAALSDCNQALQLSNNANNHNSRGLAYYRAGKFTEAIADYDVSIEGNPNVGSSFYMRGRAKRAAGVEGAQEDIDKGLSLEPGVAQRYAGYGVAE